MNLALNFANITSFSQQLSIIPNLLSLDGFRLVIQFNCDLIINHKEGVWIRISLRIFMGADQEKSLTLIKKDYQD